MDLHLPLAKCGVDEVKCNWVDAAVDETEAKADDSKDVPIFVKDVLRGRVKVKPQHEYVIRQKADEKYDDKWNHHNSNLGEQFHKKIKK